MILRQVLRAALFTLLLAAVLAAQTPPREQRAIQPAELKEWLTYIASDELQGRAVYSEGLGLAGAYIAAHLKEWGVKPAAEDGSYFQIVKVLNVRTTSNASVTVDVNGEKRTFKDGEGITFPRNMGGKQTVTGEQIHFVGYGLQLPEARIDDYAGVDPKGKVIIHMGQGPKTLPSGSRRLLTARTRNAVEKGATAVIAAPVLAAAQPRSGTPAPDAQPATASRRGSSTAATAGDFTTAQRYDVPIVPTLTARDDFLEFLFSGSDVKYSELKERASGEGPLPAFALKGVKLTINVDVEYAVVRTRLTRNVAGVIPGTDPKLNDTYVAFGAHYDHVGYLETSVAGVGVGRAGDTAPGGCTGQTRDKARDGDTIYNGADDDGSGTVALMGIAKAFALGPKPRRSLLFVWHSGEESGLQGSRYNADFPIVPADKTAAHLNMDMVGRNRCDRDGEANTVYLVGADRISTELHNLSEEANASLPNPMKLDYELNDPADPESLYTRSDHYSYASKGIPIIFYTTGLHRDYHYVTDEVRKIEFSKMARVAQLVYATGARLANLDHLPARDNKGPRATKGMAGSIEK
jgi:hypothetical protein